jgi:hypothetical protein
MSYEKPQVVLIASAVETIQGGKNDDTAESGFPTTAAYEADE